MWRRPGWRWLFRGIAVMAALFATGVAGVLAYAAFTIPSISTLDGGSGTVTLLDRSGHLIGVYGGNGESVTAEPLSQISINMQNATLAAEDKNFYHEGAFNVPRMIEALLIDGVSRSPVQGASTITQQLAKNAFLTDDKSITRKLREAFLASEIESNYTKPEILDKYLNLIYYGQGAYGVQNAAETYFGVAAAHLTIAQSSMMAGIANLPSYDDPFVNAQAAFERMHYVLTQLVATGVITSAQAQSCTAAQPKEGCDPLIGGANPTAAQAAQSLANQKAMVAQLSHGQVQNNVGPAPQYVQYILNQLQQQYPSLLSQGAITVTTTLNLQIQAKANSAVHEGVAQLASLGTNNAALVMIDSHTGQILAYVGSDNFSDNAIAGQYDMVTALRQPGSSFKPYMYEQGFRTGTLTPSTILDDTRQESNKLGGVTDWNSTYEGKITAAQSLIGSRNISTEQAMLIVGIPQVIDFAHSLGITTPIAPNVSSALGTSALRMIDQVSAYAAFSNGGTKVTAYGILSIKNSQGQVLVNNAVPVPEGEVMTAADASSLTGILSHYPTYWGIPFNRPVAAKSGTTTNYVDAWYMAYTPNFVVATWGGHTSVTDPAEIPQNGVFGNSVGDAITSPFINSLGSLVPVESFQLAPGYLPDCNKGDAFLHMRAGCVTSTPTPSASATVAQPTVSSSASTLASPTTGEPTTSPSLGTPSPTASASPTNTPLPTPTASASPSPSPTPTGIGGALVAERCGGSGSSVLRC